MRGKNPMNNVPKKHIVTFLFISWSLLYLMFSLAACASTYGTGVQAPVTPEFPKPNATPIICTPAPEGMSLRATLQPPRNVLIEGEGFEPGEYLGFVISTETSDGDSLKQEGTQPQPIGSDGRNRYKASMPLSEGETLRNGQVQVIHSRGVVCVEITIP